MGVIDIADIVAALQESGTNSWNVEAKSADQGLPNEIDATLSAFANMPEGGTIILGVSEIDNEMVVTGVKDPAEMIAGLAGKARERIQPPVQLGAIESAVIEGKHVVACVVPPQSTDRRPFRVGRHGPAYIRTGDGDYVLSEQEELYLISQRRQPNEDRVPVPGADVDYDLVPELLEQYLAEQRQQSIRLRGMGRDELLVRTNVVDHETGLPTVAAIYAMGVHPQQFLPHTAVKAHACPLPSDRQSDVRFTDRAEFSGPVPDLLDAATDWVVKHLMHGVSFIDGHGYNDAELPIVAVREIVANALVHRDLSPASFGSFPMLVKLPSQLIVENPGGLWGLTGRQLGKTSPRARNAVLYRMCASLTTPSGKRVIEGHATGIPAVIRSLNDAFLPAPVFQDEVIKFRVLLSSSTLLSSGDKEWLSKLPGSLELSVAQKHALVMMRGGASVSNSDYRAISHLDSAQAREELQQLVRFGLAEISGSGRATAYSLSRGENVTLPPTQLRLGLDKLEQPSRPKQKVVSALQSITVSATRAELAESTGLSASQTYRALKDLQHDGVVTSEKDSVDRRITRYRLAE